MVHVRYNLPRSHGISCHPSVTTKTWRFPYLHSSSRSSEDLVLVLLLTTLMSLLLILPSFHSVNFLPYLHFKPLSLWLDSTSYLSQISIPSNIWPLRSTYKGHSNFKPLFSIKRSGHEYLSTVPETSLWISRHTSGNEGCSRHLIIIRSHGHTVRNQVRELPLIKYIRNVVGVLYLWL